MVTIDDSKKIKAELEKQNQENYIEDNDDLMTVGGANRPVDIDDLGKRVLGNTIATNQELNIVRELQKDENDTVINVQDATVDQTTLNKNDLTNNEVYLKDKDTPKSEL